MATAERLLRLTHAFYERHARSFSQSRTSPWPAWAGLKPAASGRVLDLGCGNGRFLGFIREAWGFDGEYVGVDACAALLEDARRRHAGSGQAQWVLADVLSEQWGTGTFDLVVAWGLFHHIPGSEQRQSLLERMATSVGPGGQLAVSLWQFRKHQRFVRKELQPARFDIDPTWLEPNDALLDWDDDASVPRYCHHFSEDEVSKMEQQLVAARPDFEPTALNAGDGSASSDRFNAYLSFLRSA